MSAASAPTHTDGENYDDPTVFDPWRFANMRGDEGEGTKHQMVNTSTEYVPFGLGRHAWWVLHLSSHRDIIPNFPYSPGRFFAANELKALLAHIVVTYDVKMEKEGHLPDPVWYTSSKSPSRDAEVLFRKRQT